MKTASHFTYSGPGRISISRGQPRGAPAGYRVFKTLAPEGAILKLPRPQYTVFFMAQLAKLDPQATWDTLHELAGGAEPVLQCFEKPPFTATNWCHRRMVAEWFAETLGHQVDEIERQAASTAPRLL